MARDRLHPTYRPPADLEGRRPSVLAAVAGRVGIRGLRRLGFRRVVVTGDSMLPAFEPGDRLILGPAGRSRPGQWSRFPIPATPGAC